MLNKQDVLIWLKVLLADDDEWAIPELAEELGMRNLEVHDALQRGAKEDVVEPEQRAINPEAFLKMLRSLPQVHYDDSREINRGIPTALSGPPLASKVQLEEDGFVWPTPDGKERGLAIEPLHPSVPELVQNDSTLYEWLNLVETVRVGSHQKRVLAFNLLERRLRNRVEK